MMFRIDFNQFKEGTLVKIVKGMHRAPAGTLALFVPPSPGIAKHGGQPVTVRILNASNPYLKTTYRNIEYVAEPLDLQVGDEVTVLTTMGNAHRHKTIIEEIEPRPNGRPMCYVTVENKKRRYPMPWLMPTNLSNSQFKKTLMLGD